MIKKKYITNKDLYVEIIVSKAQGRLTREATRMLILLTKKAQKKMFYNSLDDRNDCLQEAMLQVFKFWFNFDEQKGDNAFAYYTEVIKRGLAQGWNKMYKYKGDKEGLVSMISLSDTFHI